MGARSPVHRPDAYHKPSPKLSAAGRGALGALVIATVLVRPASAVVLPDLLAAVAANERFEAPARADVAITCDPDCAPTATRAIFLGRGETVYVEVEGGERAIVRPGEVRTASGAAAPGAALAGTDVLLEDLAPFTADAFAVPQISDDGPAGVVVTGAPKHPSILVLLVYTIDPATNAIVRRQGYEETIGNLTRIRRDAAFVDLGGHRRPSDISVQNLRRGTTTRLRLRWREAPDAPAALFEPAGLAAPSGLAWDAAAPGATPPGASPPR